MTNSEDIEIPDNWSDADFGKWIRTTSDDANVTSIGISKSDGKLTARVNYK